MAPRRPWGDAYFILLSMCVAVFLVGTFAARPDSARLLAGITVGGQALGPNPELSAAAVAAD